MINRDELIFWFDQPPKVSKGAFNYVSEHWGNKVFFIADHPFGSHRKIIKWDDDNFGLAEMTILSEIENEEQYIQNIFEQHPNAIHVMNGFFSDIEKKIRKYVKRPNIKLAVETERPLMVKKGSSLKQKIKNVLLPIKYKINCKKYEKYVRLLMPLGIKGKELFESYGWPKEKVFSFMYCPILQEMEGARTTVSVGDLKFLYVGRFNDARVDLLMKALDGITENGWHLDMVGGYGNRAEETIAWIERHPKISFLGTWPSGEVGFRMQEYDVYLLATKLDGWNAQLNEVLNAGLGVITTNEAVSDEMVTAANAGIVVRASEPKEFEEAVRKAIQNPNLVAQWKENAKKYRSKIQGNVVGEYFMDILDYTFYNKKEKPKCPWL